MIADFATWVSPLITAALGLCAIFLDPKSKNFRYLLPVFILGIGATAILQVSDAREKDIQNIQQQENLSTLVSNNNILRSGILSVGKSVDALINRELGAMLSSFGMTPALANVSDLNHYPQDKLLSTIAINRARQSLLQKSELVKELSTPITLAYYTKEGDNPDLRRSLQETGLRLKEFKPTLAMAAKETNALWHGKDVPLEQFKLVILSLMRADVPIKRLGPVCNNPNGKAHQIDVGASNVANDMPAKTLEQVMTAKSYTELDDFRRADC